MTVIKKGSSSESDHSSQNRSIENSNMESPPKLDGDMGKVVVVGEPGCGKTSIIRAYWDRHPAGKIYSHNGVWVYPCIFEANNVQRRAAIFEIFCDDDFFEEQRKLHYETADIIIFIYAIDDPSSYRMISYKWVPEVLTFTDLTGLPVVFVGTKKDLRNDQEVIDRLALEMETPVSLQLGNELLNEVPGPAVIIECSAIDLMDVEDIFITIFDLILMYE